MVLTQCLLDEVLQSVGHVGGTRRRVLHSGHNFFFDGVDDKQQPVCKRNNILNSSGSVLQCISTPDSNKIKNLTNKVITGFLFHHHKNCKPLK